MIRRPPRSTLFPTTPLSRPPALSDAFARLLPDSPEARMRAADGSGLEGTPGEASQATGAAPGQGGALQQYTVDLTARRSGEHTLNSSHSPSSYAVFCLEKKK